MAWMMINIKTLCWNCHLNWWHKNPIEAVEWFKTKYPDRYEKLKELAKNPNLPPIDHIKVKEYLEQYL